MRDHLGWPMLCPQCGSPDLRTYQTYDGTLYQCAHCGRSALVEDPFCPRLWTMPTFRKAHAARAVRQEDVYGPTC